MELHEALVQISVIRRQLARSERFCGYRAVPVAISGMLAFAGGVIQGVWMTHPMEHLGQYLMLWIAIAVVSWAICMTDVWLRYRRSGGSLHRETTQLALEQFFPCLVAGGLLTIVIAKFTPQAAWMLPGLWAIFFSLGLFASWRLLPRTLFGVAVYFLAGGLYAIVFGSDQQMLFPWTMPLLFGIGQFLSAAVLLLSERSLPGESR